jgi:ATP-dependent Clp protease ATP-binding subunit ClpC
MGLALELSHIWRFVALSFRLCRRRFTDRAIKVVKVAGQQAADRGHHVITPELILLALSFVERGPGRMALEALGLDLERERAVIAALITEEPCGQVGNRLSLSPAVARLLDEAVAQARGMGHKYVGTEHLTLALASAGAGPTGEFLRRRGISPEALREAVLGLLPRS